MTVVSPSPRELVARLNDEERVAVDLLLEAGADAIREMIAGERPNDARLAELVPDEKRRGHLRGLSMQLALLGISVHESPTFDDTQRRHIESADVMRRHGIAVAAARRVREAELSVVALRLQEADREWLDAMPRAVRRSIERNRRRRNRL